MVIYDTFDDDDENNIEKKYPKEEYYEKQKRQDLLKKSNIKSNLQKKQNTIVNDSEDLKSAKSKLLEKKQERKRKVRLVLIVLLVFIVLFTISFRNSQIAERFSKIKELKSNLALLNKENEQLEVNIESSLNLNNIEKLAKENLGMQKQTSAQTVYISLPTQDYIEPAKEEDNIEEKNWFQEFWEYITNLL